MESLEVKRYYEWTSSNRKGKVEVYVAEDDNTIYFESGRFISKEQLDSSMMQVDESIYLERGGDSQPAPPPLIAPTSVEEWETMLGNPVPNAQPQITAKVIERSPIQIILEKQKKFQTESLDISIKFNFPLEKAIEFMTMMFDEDEVIEEVTEFIYAQMTSSEINDAIKNTIRDKIRSSLEAKSE